jgi:DNA-binding MarR family transcriptional regulator
MYSSDHVALALLAAHPEATSRHLAYELDWTRTYAAARLHSLERQGLAVAMLGDGGGFRWRVTPAGTARLADLPEPPFADVGGPLSRYKR